MLTSSGDSGASCSLVIGWLRLAVASLAVAGVFALLVALARTPVVQGLVGEAYFRVSLVGHVVFSLNVWLLSFAGALWALALGRRRIHHETKVGLVSLWLASAGAAVMAGASILGRGEPSLVDYLPVLEHPLFALGLAVFFAGVGLGALHFLVAMGRCAQPLAFELEALRWGAVAYLMALAATFVALTVGWRGDWATAAWGPGHLLQLVNAATMMAAWAFLLPSSLPPRVQAFLRATLLSFLVPGIAVPLLYVLPGPLLKGTVGGVTWAGLAVPTIVAWAVVGKAITREPARALSLGPLVASQLLFAVGVLAALLGLEGDTKVTAHYHGTVGAVTVACMGLAYRLLPIFGIRVRWPRLAGVQPLLYASGLLLLIAGLYWAASFGGQRKAFQAFAEQAGIVGPGSFIGLGALLAVIGGVVFVLILGDALGAKGRRPLIAGAQGHTALPLAEVKARAAGQQW